MKKRLLSLLAVMIMVVIASPFNQSRTAQAAGVALSQTKVTLGVDEITKLDITGTKKRVTWTSSNEKIAAVNSKGKVKAIKKGKCNIIAKVASKTYKCSIKVVAKYNKKDLAALKAIFAEQKKQGNSDADIPWSKKIPASSDFTWKAGRLVKIDWHGSHSDGARRDLDSILFGLDGNVSFSRLTALQKVDCASGHLTGIDISGCKELTELDCSENELTGIDVSNCIKLKKLNIIENEISNLNASNCTSLEILETNMNVLTSLDISNCIGLKKLYCNSNKLTKLDVSNCPDLKELECDYNELTSINVSNCIKLKWLSCNDNALTSLDISNCTGLKGLYCHNNKLTKLDVSNCPDLEELRCYDNDITELDISNCPNLEYVNVSW